MDIARKKEKKRKPSLVLTSPDIVWNAHLLGTYKQRHETKHYTDARSKVVLFRWCRGCQSEQPFLFAADQRVGVQHDWRVWMSRAGRALVYLVHQRR